MRRTLLQLVILLGLALLAGTVWNMVGYRSDPASGDGGERLVVEPSGLRLKFAVAEGRYPDARVCRRPDEDGGGGAVASGGDGEDGTAADGASGGGEAVPDTAPEPGGEPGAGAEGDGDASRAASSEEAGDGIARLGFEEARERWRSGNLFVDARAARYYEEGHIPGAVNVPAWAPDIDVRIGRLAEREPVVAPVIVYCNRSNDCEDSHIVATQMQAFGFTDLAIYEGGFPGWHEEDMPYVEGPEPGPRGPPPEARGTDGGEGAEG